MTELDELKKEIKRLEKRVSWLEGWISYMFYNTKETQPPSQLIQFSPQHKPITKHIIKTRWRK